jgi:hypothetical protein
LGRPANLGNAVKKVVKKEESICEEIKIRLKEEISEGVISTRTIELHCPPEWKRKTKPKNENVKQAVGRIFEDVNFEIYHNSVSRVLKVRLQ